MSSKINSKKTTTRHTIIKMAKNKDRERILKVLKENQLVMYEATVIRL